MNGFGVAVTVAVTVGGVGGWVHVTLRNGHGGSVIPGVDVTGVGVCDGVTTTVGVGVGEVSTVNERLATTVAPSLTFTPLTVALI